MIMLTEIQSRCMEDLTDYSHQQIYQMLMDMEMEGLYNNVYIINEWQKEYILKLEVKLQNHPNGVEVYPYYGILRFVLEDKEMNEQDIEKEIIDKNLTAPRLTPENIEDTIAGIDYHVFPNSCVTVCCLTLINGFNVVGTSACASPENFDEELGAKIARGNARDKIWELEGYLLKQNLHDEKKGNELKGAN